jgi:glutamate-5-semialdehyde dehydrogenase
MPKETESNPMNTLHELTPGMPIFYGGSHVTHVSETLAAQFQAGDRLLVVSETGDLLHVPAAEHAVAAQAVAQAWTAFGAMGQVADGQISRFFEEFAAHLEDDDTWALIAAANAADVQQAKARGRSTTRLAATETMRRDMIAGLRTWRDAPTRRGQIVERVVHDGWAVEQVADALGVVGFVFEGRPNVFADATGVLRGGNTVVFRIGADALGTARAIVAQALAPALAVAGLPPGAATLVDSAERAAGWAMFSDPRLALAVARGSGQAVAQLGSVARHAGIPVSLHGTGGAWIVADATADTEKLCQAVLHSLDRKVCNTLNVCCLPLERAAELVPCFLDALTQAGAKRGYGYKLHVAQGSESHIPDALFQTPISVRRAHGDVSEPQADILPLAQLGREWEWEETPEVTLVVVTGLAEAVALFNDYSPQFVASLITEDADHFARFYETINAPFVGNGFTRWVDGQYSLNRPELGLSNWQSGRLFARGAVLSGDGIYTVRTRVVQSDPGVCR